VGSDHGHQTVEDVIDIEAELIAAGLKDNVESEDVIAVANGVSSLIYVNPAQRERIQAIGAFLRGREWAEHVLDATTLPNVGQSAAGGLAYAVSLRTSEAENAHGLPGLALAAIPRGEKPDRLGFGQHGGLGSREQAPFLMVSGTGFAAGGSRTEATSAVDVAPTIFAHVGVTATALDGRALQR
jgi:hypothetical protein